MVTLTLGYFRRDGPYSDRIHVVLIAFLALTDKPTLPPPPMYNTLEK